MFLKKLLTSHTKYKFDYQHSFILDDFNSNLRSKFHLIINFIKYFKYFSRKNRIIENYRTSYLTNREFLTYEFNNSKYLLIRELHLNYIFKCIFYNISGFFFFWIVRFSIAGYHFVVKVAKNKRRMRLRMGFAYKIIIFLPEDIMVFYYKRRFTIIGDNLNSLKIFCNYIRNLRNLYPYKVKGLIFSMEKVKLKQGKRARTR